MNKSDHPAWQTEFLESLDRDDLISRVRILCDQYDRLKRDVENRVNTISDRAAPSHRWVIYCRNLARNGRKTAPLDQMREVMEDEAIVRRLLHGDS